MYVSVIDNMVSELNKQQLIKKYNYSSFLVNTIMLIFYSNFMIIILYCYNDNLFEMNITYKT